MTNILSFSSQKYKNHAMHHKTKYENQLTAANAFMLCLKNLPFEDLDNLCTLIQKHYIQKNIFISLEECYEITQRYNSKDTDKTILSLAYKLIHSGKTLGTKERENGEGPSSLWLNHALITAEIAENLAKKQGLDTDTAKKLALLHDIGRKFIHTPLHIIAGFEYLIDEGYYDESFICLTHSFLYHKNALGKRCATSEPITNNFYIDENGNPELMLNAPKDDMTLFLEKYRYSPYDAIINLADLMASSQQTLSPYERINEIKGKKQSKNINNKFFTITLCNNMIAYLKSIQELPKNIDIELNYTQVQSEEELDKIFFNVSQLFTDTYNKTKNTNIPEKPSQKIKKQN